MNDVIKKGRSSIAAFAFVCAACMGIVVHPAAEPAASWAGRPSDAVVGRWNTNGSCVAMGPACVITTKHQGGAEGSAVVIDGVSYKVVRIANHPIADVRVARLRYANLSEYAALNTTGIEQGKTVVLGGFGRQRGAELTTSGMPWGYRWAGDNSTLTWATNYVDAVINSKGFNYLVIDFDESGRGATEYEGILAAYDSGGGLFYEEYAGWRLYGLCCGVSMPAGYNSAAYFKNPDLSTGTQTGRFHKVRDYAHWANDAAAQLSACGSYPADIDEDCRVNESDITELGKFWGRKPPSGDAANGDTNADGIVNLLDFVKIYNNWGIDYY
ncbi:MAG: dockerin type I domain-containing protein [Phycisphaerae bacterium]